MENRALIALALSFVVFMVFIYIGEKSRVVPPPGQSQQAQQAQPAAPAAQPQAPAPAAKPAAPPAPVKPAAAPGRPARDVVVETPL